MTRAKIVLAGAGGHAGSCVDVVEQNDQFEIAGLVGSASELGLRVFGYPVIGTDADLSALRENFPAALVAIGQIRTADHRIRLFSLLERSGFALPVIVSPRAYVSPHAKLGAGTIVMHGAVVNAGAVIGRNCIINSQALVEHDAVVADHCHIATAVAVNGGVRIGAGTFIGSGSRILQGVTIGDGCLIGMGQQIFSDCSPGSRTPALKGPV